MDEQDRKRIHENIEKSKRASAKSRFLSTGKTTEATKINSKNFDRILSQRGIPKDKRSELLNSADMSEDMTARHAKSGEKFLSTHGVERSSGIFVSKTSQGITSDERIDKLALPHTNSAEYETTVELSRDQDLIETKVAKQKHFQNMDPKQRSRDGGGYQVITDGGYNSGAITNRDTKYPISQSDTKKHGNNQEYKM